MNVWGNRDGRKTDEKIAAEGLAAMEEWMKELGVVMNIRELGVSEDMLEGLVGSTLTMEGGYKILTKDEIAGIFRESLSFEI